MTLPYDPTPRPTPTPPIGRIDRRLRAAVVAVLFGLAPLSAGPAFVDYTGESDELLAYKAKSAIATDRSLAGINLSVSVVDRVAVVGGPVPDQATADRVEAVLRIVPGLARVTVRCWVAPPDDPFGDRVSELVADPNSVASVVPPLVYPSRPGDLRADPTALAWNPGATTTWPDRNAVVVRRQSRPAFEGFLLDPVVAGSPRPRSATIPELPMPGRADGVTPYPTIPPQGVPTTPNTTGPSSTQPSMAEEVGRIRDSDPRFGWLTIRLDGGTATVSGRAVHKSDAWDYAAKLRGVTGIDRVVVGEIVPR